MTTYYKATLADGTVLTRSTASRKYVAAVRGAYETWCGSMQRAHQEAASAAQNHRGLVAQMAPAVEITAAEYRAIKGGRR